MNNEEALRAILEDFVAQVTALLRELPEQPETAPVGSVDLPVFFKEVRSSLFGGKLTATQVSGTEAKVKVFKEAGFPVSWAAYALATSYHETARKMIPVKEGLALSDAWRKKNLRYYPWYGRGDVQLTWEANYKRADKELGLDGKLVNNLDLALDPAISARIMVSGMREGWFSGDKTGRHTLERHLPNPTGTLAQFKQSRRIINLMDKADLIAGYAVKFQDALQKAEY